MDRVYVGNLPPDIGIKDIDDIFRPFGKLVYVDINYRANPVCACLQFDSPRNAFDAVKSRHGFNYAGYTLQLRLFENEVRERRDATPPPPPPMFSCFDRQANIGSNNLIGGNFSGDAFQQDSNTQWSNNSRSGMLQQQNMGYSLNNRSNNQQNLMQYSSSGRSNMQQQYSNNSITDQQYSNSSRSTMLQQFSDSKRFNMPQNNYRNRSGIPQQNMNYSNNSSWVVGNNNMDWNSGNFADNGNFSNNGSNNIYNPNSDPYAKLGFEENYTRSLSGSGRKWFNRYINQGFSPEIAREKALEHRTLPYLRGEQKTQIPHDPTNLALETIGNTIMSLMSTGQGGKNRSSDKPGPSKSTSKVAKVAKVPYTAISNQLDSKNQHTQAVKKYKQFETTSSQPNAFSNLGNVNKDGPINLISSEAQLWDEFTKKKDLLFIEATSMVLGKNKTPKGLSYKKRVKTLINEVAISEREAKTLALLHYDKLKDLLSLKKRYDTVSLKKEYNMVRDENSLKLADYRRDIKFIGMYQNHRISKLSPNIVADLLKCITRIHKYEEEKNLPLTNSEFIQIMQRKHIKKGEETSVTSVQNSQEKQVKTNIQHDDKHHESQNNGDQTQSSITLISDKLPTKIDYRKSHNVLNNIRGIPIRTKRMLERKKRHVAVVKKYKQFVENGDKPSQNVPIVANYSEPQLWNKINNMKEDLLKEASCLIKKTNENISEPYNIRKRLLMNDAAVSKGDAEVLALLPLVKLNDFISLKKHYISIMKDDFVAEDEKTRSVGNYMKDLKYISLYENHKVATLEAKLKADLFECIKRVYNYEREQRLPRTRSKFITSMLKHHDPQGENIRKKKAAAKSLNKKETELKKSETTLSVDDESGQNKEENTGDTVDNQYNEECKDSVGKPHEDIIVNISNSQENENITEEQHEENVEACDYSQVEENTSNDNEDKDLIQN